jgi:peptidoglycan/xylan/chitin deacetylase (PgdA/CDA1 family)
VINFVKNWIRPVARRAEAAILMYHRIGDPGRDPWRLAVRPERFAEHLHVLRHNARPMGLRQLTKELRERTLKPGAVAVTFDDGYANNLYEAKPLLERYKVPATVFVTSGMVGRGREFWWDELEAIILASRKLPRALRLEIAGKTYEWVPMEDARNSPKPRRSEKAGRGWAGQPLSRDAFYFSVWEKLKPLSPTTREKALDDIRAWAGNFHDLRDSHRPLRTDELHALDGGIVEVGAHTVSHPSLTRHPPDIQKLEIRESKRWLEEFLGRSVRAFAYPYGDYSRATAAVVEEAGFDLACTTHASAVFSGNDPYELPRIAINDWDGTEFARCLTDTLSPSTTRPRR